MPGGGGGGGCCSWPAVGGVFRLRDLVAAGAGWPSSRRRSVWNVPTGGGGGGCERLVSEGFTVDGGATVCCELCAEARDAGCC